MPARACRHVVLPLRPHCSPCLARVEEIDQQLLAERELLQSCGLEA